MRLLLVGGGQLGRQFLRDVSEAGGHEIVVVDADRDTAEALADEYDALVLHGDATDPGMLEEARIGEADALVVATGSDATNIVIAMLGRRAEVERIIVRLEANALRGALQEIGVTEIVAPTMAAAARMEAALHGESRFDLEEVVQGRLQLEEVTAGPGVDGRRVRDLEVPDSALLVTVVRGSEASLARGDVRLAEGDVVVVVAESEDALDTCRKALDG